MTAVKVPGPSISVAYGKALSTSNTTIDNGATVNAAQVTSIDARNTNEFETSATSTQVAPGLYNPKFITNIQNKFTGQDAVGGQPVTANNQGSGASVAVSNYNSTSTTQINGSVTSGGSASIGSESLNETDSTLSETVVRNKPLLEPVIKALGDKISKSGQGFGFNDGNIRQKTGKIGIAAGVSYAQANNQADVHIGTTGAVNVGGNLDVSSEAEDPFRALAIGAALSNSEFAIAGAVAVSNESNQAFASIESTVGVNAAGKLNLSADAKIPMKLKVIAQAAQLYSFFNNNVQ